jgi:hypothetical protein
MDLNLGRMDAQTLSLPSLRASMCGNSTQNSLHTFPGFCSTRFGGSLRNVS